MPDTERYIEYQLLQELLMRLFGFTILKEPIVWFVGQVRNGEDEIQGIAETRDEAITMCRDENYFITPLEIGKPLAHDTEYLVLNNNIWFPKR